jgi:cytochrome c oxidase subunit 1
VLHEQRLRASVPRGSGRVRPSAPADYLLPVPTRRRGAGARLAVAGLAALIGSGLFSVLLVLARTPGVNAWLPGRRLLPHALVVHVDLSVLVWFVALGRHAVEPEPACGRARLDAAGLRSPCRGRGTAMMALPRLRRPGRRR